MYLLAIHIPVFLDGPHQFLEDDWMRDVFLARDWLAPYFGGLTLLSPWRPVETRTAKLQPLRVDDGVRVVPWLDDRCRSLEFWRHQRRPAREIVKELLLKSQVFHTVMDDLYRPMCQLAFAVAVKSGVPTVLYGPDVDLLSTWRLETQGRPVASKIRERLYAEAHTRMLRHWLRRADLALLKEGPVYDRYGRFAMNAKPLCHTMYSRQDVIPELALEERLSSAMAGRPLRVVYCGRIIARKRLDVAINVVARARQRGVRAVFEIIGEGDAKGNLQDLVQLLGAAEYVRFVGHIPYGPGLLERLRTYDLLLFTSTLDETPRMIFDGYAAGLPLLSTDIGFVRYRADADRAAITFRVEDVDAGAERLGSLDRDRATLAALSRRARSAGLHHATEEWYGRRAEWTREAVARRRALDGNRAGGRTGVGP